MSLLADPRPSPAPAPPPPGGARSRLAALRWAVAPLAGPALTLAIASAIAATSFVADGGLRLEPTSHVLIAWMLAGGGLAAAAVLAPPPRTLRVPLHGVGLLAALTVLAALTAASIAWSFSPAASWEEANRALGYLGVVVAGLALARLLPHRWPALLTGIGLGAVIVCGWALLTKVLPGALAPDETYARLREPFGYWNAVGGMGAIGMLPLLWLAARRDGHAAVNALAWPGMAILVCAVMLSYSRGALVALAGGLAFWFLVTPIRLRGALALAASAAGAAAAVAWAFSQEALTSDRVPLPVREDAGVELGLLLVLLLLALLFSGLAVNFAAAARPPREGARRRAGRGVLAALAVVPVAILLALAAAPGGIGGQVSSTWREITDPQAETPANEPGRLTQASSVRARYWREALAIHESSPWLGTGAGTYVIARTRVRSGPLLEVRHAHGYVVQTMSDLGWAGVGASLLVLIAWAVAVARTAGLGRRGRRLPWDAERVGMASLAAVGVAYGMHSLLDFTWFIPGLTVPALLAVGWLAGARPLRERMTAPASAAGAAPSRRAPMRRWQPAAAVALVVVALAGAWTALQPVRAANASDAALERLDEGNPDVAASIARIASERNPLSVEPLWDLAAIELSRGRPMAARSALERAVYLEPANPETWRRLGRFRLDVGADPRGALRAFEAAYYLDPQAPRSGSDVLEARRAVQAREDA